MSVLSVKEALGSPSGGEENEKGETVYHRRFVVTTSSWQDGPVTVIQAPGIPAIFSPYQVGSEGDSKALCRRRNPERSPDNPRVWFVACEFGPVDVGTWGGDPGEPPDPEAPFVTEISTGTKTVMLAVKADINGDLVANSSGEPFEEAAEVETTHATVRIRRYEAEGLNILMPLYVNMINSDAFMGVDPFYAMCPSARGVRQFTDQGVVYWEADYEFEFAPESFLFHFLDQGYNVTIGQAGAKNRSHPSPSDTVAETQETITDSLGIPVRRPVLKDGQGGILLSGEDPVFLTKHLRREVNFAGLQMPWLRVRLTKDDRWD